MGIKNIFCISEIIVNNKGNIAPKKQHSPLKKECSSDLMRTVLEKESMDKRLLVKKTTIIPPKCFKKHITLEEFNPTIASSKETKYLYVDKNSRENGDDARIHSSFNPETLDIINEHINSTHIDNLSYPYGSIAISSTLDKTLSTSGLWQCAGISFVDKKHNLQTLLHLAPGVQKESNDALIDYILSFSKPEDLEIEIVPGCYNETDNTIEYAVNKIKGNNDKYNIKFANFPDFDNTVLVLQNGKLKCTNYQQCNYTEINPKDKIINA